LISQVLQTALKPRGINWLRKNWGNIQCMWRFGGETFAKEAFCKIDANNTDSWNGNTCDSEVGTWKETVIKY
jgi:hypothetical protein